MPVKGQLTKSRTAKSTKKGLKLKWWYILPVIAIVTVAGYAIVRFSEASALTFSKTVANKYLRGGTTTYKSSYGDAKLVSTGGSISAYVNLNELSKSKKICARALLSKQNGGPVRGTLVWKSKNPSSDRSISFSGSGLQQYCLDATKINKRADGNLIITSKDGNIAVFSIYGTN
jgi:hypothetical protein